MWSVEQRRAYERDGLRYPSDLTDAEWALVEPLIPPAKRGGRERTVDVREVLNGIFYVLATGCPSGAAVAAPAPTGTDDRRCRSWRALPKDLPPKSTVHDYLTRWAWDGALGRLHHALFVRVREQAGKAASPTAAIIDSQSVKSAEKGGRASIRRATTRARRSRARSGTSPRPSPDGCCAADG
jgi:transposase